MREIKFRAWHKTAEKSEPTMTYFKLEHGYGLNTNFFDAAFNKRHGVGGIMQFTDLKDKNGKDIYEGDIISFKVDFPDQEFDNGVVRWADGGYWTSQTEDDLEELLSEELSDLPGEVIGNIYETPELVTPK